MEQETIQGNGLAQAASAYLRSAVHQPVDWQEWGEAAFARAAAEDKPILLDIGAVWCHWCHVMDRESYENPTIAGIINDHFIAVKVDRDERPDVDSRYQAAVQAISGQGGWPLTAFLTPDGHPFFGGTYFPPEDRHGRPGLPRVLATMAEAYRDRRQEVQESAASVLNAVEHSEGFNGRAGEPGEALASKMVRSILQQFDDRNGGFGSQPKFPHPATLDLLLHLAGRGIALNSAARKAALVTLEKMAAGGIYDQLAGGFHRYSVDERWIVPHFEKMSYDNSELLKNYVHAATAFGQTDAARIVRETIAWVDAWLSDQKNGGFYASQDADVTLDDDGDYFTWTRAEAEAVLDGKEFAVASSFYDIGAVGDMHHNPQKNVLNRPGSLEATAKFAGVSADEASTLIAQAKAKLYAARLQRPTPYIDTTIYTAWNAMMASAYLLAGRALGMPQATAFGLKSLDRALFEAWSTDHGMRHVVAYAGGTTQQSPIAGGLDDYLWMAHAALDAYEATGEMRYYHAAKSITDSTIARFHDRTGSAFFDTEILAPGEQRLGVLNVRRKPLQDSPTPAGNPTAASLLLRLANLTGDEAMRAIAEDTLESFAGIVEHFGLYAGSYGLALQRLIYAPIDVVIIGPKDDALANELEAAALAHFAVHQSVIRLTREQLLDELPPAMAETLPHLTLPETACAIVCSNNTCQPPVISADALTDLLALDDLEPEMPACDGRSF
jgi:uncharacterized protein YyaL (SSP411 family)